MAARGGVSISKGLLEHSDNRSINCQFHSDKPPFFLKNRSPLWKEGHAGPPELCACTHAPNTPEGDCRDGPLFAADSDAIAYGSSVVYDSGLLHRGLANKGAQSAGPRLMLHLILAPEGSLVRRG